ncbi:metal-binding protein [Roseibium sp. TrichSKD4]|uniref:DUF411 domain-containing protein n=1 Tax=Roseibium sp. TrichSKD4 TaxID=744980 RepID=UPI0001E568FF|nr:DUF411 domain-containing protein [Roseibium sp. TrichSKD4]EFO30590.1 metal-binding protein [Roseibium sp. TrichSKD4]
MLKNKRSIASGLVAAALLISGASLADDNGSKGRMTVYKTPWCGCCTAWSERMEAEGYRVVVHNMEDLTPIRQQAGVPDDMQGCHTAVVEMGKKYVVEGHVPPAAISKMLDDQPDIRGIAVPGMPAGSVGMGERPDARYTVFSLAGKSGAKPQPFMEFGAN